MNRSVIQGLLVGLMTVVLAATPMQAATAASSGARASGEDRVVIASDFETDTGAWHGRGSAEIALAPVAHGGASSALVSGRTAPWNGIETDATSLFTPGTTYTISAWVKLPAGSIPTELTLTVAEAPEAYTRVSGPTPVTVDNWVELTGTYTVPTTLTSAMLYIEAASATADFLVDDLLVTTAGGDVPVDLGLSNDFEMSLGAWGARGDGTSTADRTTLDAYAGAQSALVANRTQPWNGIGADVTNRFVEGTTYDISAWVKLAPAAVTTELRLSIQRENAGATTYESITTAAGVTALSWTRVYGTVTMKAADKALLYIETATSTNSFLVDDIVITTATAPPIQTDIASLKEGLPWPVGVAVDERETTGAPADLVTKHYNQITPENYLKPEAIQPSEGVFTFEATDKLVDFAIANDMRFYGHTLVWHSQTPDWFFLRTDGTPLTNSAADQQLLTDRMRTHIETVADHFRTKYGEFGTAGNPIVAFDVVNEAIAESEDDGLRRSRWYDVLGEGFLDLAFRFASESFNGGAADGPVTLFLNDYSTEAPAKRQAMFDVVSRMLARDVPVDALGHQFHVTLAQPIAQMKASIDKFAELGLRQSVSEFDVQIDGMVTEQKIVDQGYFYADTFDMLRQYPELFSVTLWGPYDSRSWLPGAPLPFDTALQAKPAYYGIVDRRMLPARTFAVNAPAADIPIDDQAPTSPEWALLPLEQVGTDPDDGTGFSVRWAEDHLTAYIAVEDPTHDGDGDTVTIFAGDTSLVIPRDGSNSGVISETADGFIVVAELPLPDLVDSGTVAFDIRIVDAGTGKTRSWNDQSNSQEDGAQLGVVNLVSPIRYVEIPRVAVAPTIDGQVDAAWSGASLVSTDIQLAGAGGATSEVRMLWSDGAVNFLFRVTDPQLDDTASNAYEQDSVEMFLDPINAKAGGFLAADGQYRVNFRNAQSISGDLSVIGDSLTSATSLIDGGYIVEVALALGAETREGALIGLEMQVNDATAGVRNSVRSWADPSGRSYQDTSRWGVARLIASTDQTISNVEPPSVSGSAVVGSTLKATPGRWSIATPTVEYQWNRDGVSIADATGSTFLVTSSDAGHSITVTATARAVGYRPASVESAAYPIAKVASSSRGALSRFLSFGGAGLNYDFSVRGLDIVPTGTITVFDNGRSIASRNLEAADAGRATLSLPRLSRGFHVITCRYEGNEQLARSVCPPRLVIVL
jgi:endo-1,4-beta-xylanase